MSAQPVSVSVPVSRQEKLLDHLRKQKEDAKSKLMWEFVKLVPTAAFCVLFAIVAFAQSHRLPEGWNLLASCFVLVIIYAGIVVYQIAEIGHNLTFYLKLAAKFETNRRATHILSS